MSFDRLRLYDAGHFHDVDLPDWYHEANRLCESCYDPEPRMRTGLSLKRMFARYSACSPSRKALSVMRFRRLA